MSTRPNANRKTLLKLAAFSLAMFGFGYAMVPFYPVVCRAMGINQVGVDEYPLNTQVDRSRIVSVEFDTNVHGMPWRFRPLTRSLSVRPGEIAQAVFEVENVRDVPVTGQAIPSYGPSKAAEYFRKLDCFCFNKQTLAPGEKRQMPVVFVVDPSLPKEIPAITLSYTFFEVEGNRRTAAVATVREGA